ncbi:hypothetical protein JTE90_016121 [Oedothorax gibbosus]|uniref:Uncharacterized protein n=1 Tax=Oedothorax gibbosus TaxID=931172 RepID=A0AAV6U7A0_9ARAC|nr:hypothetical protein JTE90_016121 [Oedothorax gibbosus]
MDSIRYSEKGWSYRLNSSSCVQVILWLALSGVETAKRIEVCRFQQATSQVSTLGEIRNTQVVITIDRLRLSRLYALRESQTDTSSEHGKLQIEHSSEISITT